ncbi:MAG: macro domain-containing protein [Chloroflexi bacterium]|nr:macro domain-containing protein [Chloroflexota bacterium]
MLAYLNTSIFDSPAQTIVNTVNTVGVMGKGIALSFKTLYPAMYEEYRRLCEAGKLSIGKLHVYRTPNKIIVNFPTKKHWRAPSHPEYIEAGLKAFVKHYAEYGISSVSFPQLGCGHGELNWKKQVQPLMEKYLKVLPIPVYIHLYPGKPNFVPERLDADYAREVLRERRRISSAQLWLDLSAITGEDASGGKQLGSFGPRVWVDDRFVHFHPLASEDDCSVDVYRGDVEDLWNTLRLKGTIQETELPQNILNSGASDWLMDLLVRLDYVKPVEIRVTDDAEPERGLQYAPPAEVEPPAHMVAML